MRRLQQVTKIKKIDLEKYAPPGVNIKQQTDFFMAGNIISAIISLYFFVEYFNQYQNLFGFNGIKRELIKGATMPDFPLILDKFLIGFLITGACMLLFVIYYYLYYYQGGSKSIYLMKRLPHKIEIHKRAWTLPIVLCILSLLIAFIIAFCYFVFYLAVTPEECLKPEQWQKFISFFSYFI